MSSEKPPADECETGHMAAAAAGENSDNASRRDAWNRPVNGVAAAEAGIVIGGADVWPSLTEGLNTRVKPSYRTVPPESSVSLIGNASTSRRNVVGHSGGRNNATQNGARSGSHRQPKNNAARSSVGNGDRTHQQRRQSSQGLVSDVSSNNGLNNGNSQVADGQRNGPRPHHSGGNHSQDRDSNTRGIGGSSHGDSSYARRHNVDRDANSQPPSFNGINATAQPPVFPGPLPIPFAPASLPVPPYAPPPPPLFSPIPFMAPGIRQFAGRPIFYGPPVSQFALRPHPRYIPGRPQFIVTELLKQIDYYFSDDNLVRDVHLRRNMDEQGWVMVTIIAKFKKVKEILAKVEKFLDDNKIDPLQFILNAMLNSFNVEVQGDKLRKRINWEKYILRSSGESSSTTAESQANEELAGCLENTVMEEEHVCNVSEAEADDKTTYDQAGQ